MTTPRRPTLAAALVAALLAACSSGGGDAGPSAPYPTAPDALERGPGNDAVADATPVTLGTLRQLSIYPVGDVDWFAVQLTAGTAYEFSTDPIAAATDTRIDLYAPDGVTLLDDNDDWVGYDSAVQFTPETSGTYYVGVRAYDATYGIATYNLGVRLFVDEDADTYSSYFDCDDQDANVFPWADEIPGDGIDQDCTGVDALVASQPDAAEEDDTAANARTLTLTTIDAESVLHKVDTFRNNSRTLHAAGDADWFKFTLPAFGALYIERYGDCAPGVLYDSDATTVLDETSCTYLYPENPTAAPKTFFVKYQSDADPFTAIHYVPIAYSIGVDRDQDGYFTRDWASDRDCDDADPEVHPGAAEIAGDGIDQDCNGIDPDPT